MAIREAAAIEGKGSVDWDLEYPVSSTADVICSATAVAAMISSRVFLVVVSALIEGSFVILAPSMFKCTVALGSAPDRESPILGLALSTAACFSVRGETMTLSCDRSEGVSFFAFLPTRGSFSALCVDEAC
jgi:hypothetical protein